MKKTTFFLRGIRDGLPIAIGYFAVAFALGIRATAAGLMPWQSALLSFLNLTSAGEAAGIVLLGAGTTYVELAFTQLVINIRYLLMSCSLSQKFAPEVNVLHRLLVGYGITDEIFGVSAAQDAPLSPYYNYGAIAVAAPGWTLGTLLGAVMGDILPVRAVAALGVALYAMFLAVILPPARKSRIIAGLVAVSMAASAGLTFICQHFSLTRFTEGFRIIALTVTISLVAAILFPVKEKNADTGVETEVANNG